MGTGSVLYRVMLLAFIVTAIVGFGGLLTNGVTNARAFHSRAVQARTLLQGSQAMARIASFAIYGLLALGIVLIAISDSTYRFGAPWVLAALVVWLAVVGISFGMVRPSVAGILGRADALEPEAIVDGDPEAGSLATRLAFGEGLIQVLLIAALYLMIWQPGN
ncbi:MAG: hypothetical protein AAF531_10825 [Actinomycetota bacterium]